MGQAARKAAVRAWREKPAAWGVFAVICRATGQAWVGSSPTVDQRKNGLWFTLRLGSSPYASLQAAWAEHGEGAFEFQELERLRPDYPEVGREDELKRRRKLWLDRLEASPL